MRTSTPTIHSHHLALLLSSCPSTQSSRMMERIKRGSDSRGLVSNSRTVATCDNDQDFIRTPIGTFKYFTESLWSPLSNGSGLMSIPILSWAQSSFSYRTVFSPWCCATLFWPNGPCIQLSPLGARPRVGGRLPSTYPPPAADMGELGFVFTN